MRGYIIKRRQRHWHLLGYRLYKGRRRRVRSKQSQKVLTCQIKHKKYSDYLVNGVPLWQLEHRGMTEQKVGAFRQEYERLNKLVDKPISAAASLKWIEADTDQRVREMGHEIAKKEVSLLVKPAIQITTTVKSRLPKQERVECLACRKPAVR